MSKKRISGFESVLFEEMGANSSGDEDDGDMDVLTTDIVNMKNKLRIWVIKHLITGDALQYLLKILEDCNILSPKEAQALKKGLASSAHKGSIRETKSTNDSNLPIILREIKSLKKALHYTLEKQQKMTKSQMKEFTAFREEIRGANGIAKTLLPKMPFNSREKFEEFDKELQESEDMLEQFKRVFSKIEADDVTSFGCACLRKLMTDELALKYNWKTAKNNKGISDMFAISVIKEMAQQLIPNVTENRIIAVLQGYVINASDRIRERPKIEKTSDSSIALNEISMEEDEEYDNTMPSMADDYEEPLPSKFGGNKRKRPKSTQQSSVDAEEDIFSNLDAHPHISEESIHKFEFYDPVQEDPSTDPQDMVSEQEFISEKENMTNNITRPPTLLNVLKAVKEKDNLQKSREVTLIKMIPDLTNEIIGLRKDLYVRPVQPLYRNMNNIEEKLFLPTLSLNSLENFQKLEEDLRKDERVKADLMRFLRKIESEEMLFFLRKAVRKIITDEVAILFTWRGTNNKSSIQHTLVIQVIKDVCQEKFPFADYKRICSILQQHIVHATDRMKRRQTKTE